MFRESNGELEMQNTNMDNLSWVLDFERPVMGWKNFCDKVRGGKTYRDAIKPICGVRGSPWQTFKSSNSCSEDRGERFNWKGSRSGLTKDSTSANEQN
ncbi:hypothetical protein RUM44_002544 [Polyplax serrata]|uniref:Uncharacterized protein n=1 Tax=Polyplax serrata TaxID=468196 RepID=A0ABR1AF34_POLSC